MVFAEARLTEFEMTAICNGMKCDTFLLVALGLLFSGQAKAVYNLHMAEETSPTHQEMRVKVIAEFKQRRATTRK